YSRPGDAVLDPFSGRGTVPLQAAAEGRIGVGNDLNPFAWCLTAAKVEPASRPEARTRMTSLRLAYRSGAAAWRERALALQPPPPPAAAPPAPAPAEAALAFPPEPFAQVLFLRATLRLDATVDRFLAAATTGILHGKSPSYLSTLMPNTFSMAPRYVRDYAAR